MAYNSSKDKYYQFPHDPTVPATKVAAVSPHDTNDLSWYAKALYIGVAGDVTVIPVGQTGSVTFKAHPVGYFVGCRVMRVLATGTTATNILALYD